jgi:serine/threonine-protein kinase RsbW
MAFSGVDDVIWNLSCGFPGESTMPHEGGIVSNMPCLFLIERDKDFADCLSRILQAEGFDVVWTESVEQALAVASNFTADAAVIDLHDGEAMGSDDVLALKDGFANLPILVTAHYQTPDVACKALGVGAQDYLLKPFGTREILDHVRKITGYGKTDGRDTSIHGISSGIRFISDLSDILKICLDQLASTLHLTDCLVALRDGDSFRVAAGKGYRPDPVGRSIKLSKETIELLEIDSTENIKLATDGVREVVSALGLIGHRPFPILMPLESHDNSGEGLKGFIMGHGGIVLEQEDILEMERFLAQVSRELSSIPESSISTSGNVRFEREGEIRIPEIGRTEAVELILEEVSPYISHESYLFWIRLAIDEAISNAIIHGHNDSLSRPQRTVVVRYAAGSGRLVFMVEDSGEGFDPDSVPDPTAEENLLNVNGRGIFLMRQIMDEVLYNDKGNQVTMVKVLDGGSAHPFRLRDERDLAIGSY